MDPNVHTEEASQEQQQPQGTQMQRSDVQNNDFDEKQNSTQISNLNSQFSRQQSEVAGTETVENRTEVEVCRENLEGREDVEEGSPQERESGERSTAEP